MSSRIEQLIDELEEYIESCKPKFMSNSEIIVNKEEIDEFRQCCAIRGNVMSWKFGKMQVSCQFL